MSRFQPDGVHELLSQTFAMAQIGAGTYVEIMAPDLRPAALVLLALALGCFWLWRSVRKVRSPMDPSTRVLVATLGAWTVAWLAWLVVSGNGRYVLPLLLIVGPLLGAVLWRIPIREDWRWLLLCVVVATQVVLLYNASPSGAWSMLKSSWNVAPPFPSQDALLAPLRPDVVLATHAQTMSAALVNTDAVREVRLVSLDFADAMGSKSVERAAATAAIAGAKRPVVVDAFNLDFIPADSIPSVRWRKRSEQVLASFGLEIDPTSCQKNISPVNIMLVACAVRPGASKPTTLLEPAPAAVRSMDRLIALCAGRLWPIGARHVEADGSVVQVFRESRYIVRAGVDGTLGVRFRQDLNFRQRWDGQLPDSLWEKVRCDEFIQSKM